MKLQNIFRSVFIAVVISLLFHSILFARPPEYRVVPIPAQLGGGRLNDSGVVVGTRGPAWARTAWMWNRGLITNLPGLGSGDFEDQYANDINNSSVIVGRVNNNEVHACEWHNGMLSIIDAPGYELNWANGINSSGTVVGECNDTTVSGWPRYPFIYTGSVVVLNWLEGYSFSAINDSNVITGPLWWGPENKRAFLYYNGTFTFLSDPGTTAEALDINNSNHVLGGTPEVGCCLWRDGTQVLLEPLKRGGALGGLNDYDAVVGYAWNLGAVIWENGEVRPLSDLIDPALDLHFWNACDINNKGEILCMGSDSLAYLLIPIRVITVRDAKDDTIPNVEFNLIKVTNNPPTFTEDMLGSFTTDSLGQLKLTIVAEDTFSVELSTGTKKLVVGDSLKIAKKIYNQPTVKHSGILGTMYSITLDNAKFDSASAMSFDTLNSKGTQDIVLEHTELRYNLLVSMEWDAALSYLTSLQAGFRAMSNYLYDVSDGQVMLDTVMIFDNKEHWDEADVKIYASNMITPHMDFGIGSYSSGSPIELPRKWFGEPDDTRNGTHLENPLNLVDDKDFRAKAHEFGHYGLLFDDEYEFLAGVHCPSVLNFGFMDYEYPGYLDPAAATEMSSSFKYQSTDCQNTMQWVSCGGRSCWDFLEHLMEKKYTADSIFIPIIKPDDPERTLPSGLDYLPGPNNEKYFSPAVMDYDVGALIKFPILPLPPDPNIVTLNVQVTKPGGVCPKADVTLFNNYFSLTPRTIYQGQTSDIDPDPQSWGGGCIWVVGASQSNRLIRASVGQVTVLPKELKLAKVLGNKVWMCGEASVGGLKEKRVNNQFRSNGDSVIIQLKPVEGDYPLICGVNLGDNTLTYQLNILNTFSANPTMDLLPDIGGQHNYNFTYDGTKYTVQINDTLGNSGTFTLWAIDDSSNNFFFNTDYTITQLDTSAVNWNLMGPQGGAEFWVDTLNSGIQKGMILSSPYLIIRTGLDTVNIQAGETYSFSIYPPTSLTGNNRITIRYADSDLDIGYGIKGRESSLKVFHWNESSNQWEQIGGTVDTIQNEVSTAITDLGAYAAFTTELLTDVKDNEQGSVIPDRFELKQNYPNPFNANTTIKFSLKTSEEVQINIYNVSGQKVRNLLEKKMPAGIHQVIWDGKDDFGKEVSSGVYFYQVQAGDYKETKKMILLK
jgi:hypothetical protein